MLSYLLVVAIIFVSKNKRFEKTRNPYVLHIFKQRAHDCGCFLTPENNPHQSCLGPWGLYRGTVHAANNPSVSQRKRMILLSEPGSSLCVLLLSRGQSSPNNIAYPFGIVQPNSQFKESL
jgi:hypothetical protein